MTSIAFQYYDRKQLMDDELHRVIRSNLLHICDIFLVHHLYSRDEQFSLMLFFFVCLFVCFPSPFLPSRN